MDSAIANLGSLQMLNWFMLLTDVELIWNIKRQKICGEEYFLHECDVFSNFEVFIAIEGGIALYE
jgi:hypothetical protein